MLAHAPVPTHSVPPTHRARRAGSESSRGQRAALWYTASVRRATSCQQYMPATRACWRAGSTADTRSSACMQPRSHAHAHGRVGPCAARYALDDADCACAARVAESQHASMNGSASGARPFRAQLAPTRHAGASCHAMRCTGGPHPQEPLEEADTHAGCQKHDATSMLLLMVMQGCGGRSMVVAWCYPTGTAWPPPAQAQPANPAGRAPPAAACPQAAPAGQDRARGRGRQAVALLGRARRRLPRAVSSAKRQLTTVARRGASRCAVFVCCAHAVNRSRSEQVGQ